MSVPSPSLTCPLCHHTAASGWSEWIAQDKRLCYECPVCTLVFVDPSLLPDSNKELARYEEHNNKEDEGYVRFLSQALHPTLRHLPAASRGIDYGCGPEPVLSRLFASHGHTCETYDPFFFPTPPSPPYDFMTATECAEHFHNPGEEWRRMVDLLKPGGILTIMTEWRKDKERFRSWWYTRDYTHVCFYALPCFEFIARTLGLEVLENDSRRVVVFRKIGE